VSKRESQAMRLKILLPTEVLVDEEARKVTATAANGSFCLLPRHVDFVAALVPSVLSFHQPQGRERFAAIDEGLLIKCGDLVTVSTLNGALGDELERLQAHVRERFLELDEHARKARSAVFRLEAGALRSFYELQEQRHG